MVLAVFKRLSFAFHSAIASSPLLARLYLCTISAFARRFPRGLMKQRFVNSLSSVKWPAVDLPGKNVSVGKQTPIALYPHVGEFDFDVLFNRDVAREKELFDSLEPRLAQYDAIIEIGANVGIFSIFFAKRFQNMGRPGAPVFAFEPSAEAFSRLLRNAALNAVPNLHPFNCAVSDRPGFLDFFAPEGHLTNGSLSSDFARIFTDNVRRETVFSITGEQLESLVRTYDRILIKIDTEGSEAAILKSLQDLIVAKRPDIIVEVLEPFRDILNKSEALAGYSRFNITDAGLVQHEQFQDTPFSDYILIPARKAVEATAPLASSASV